MGSATCVHLVADHAILRENLALLLRREGVTVREWDAGFAVAEPKRFADADVVIVALSGGAGSGLDFVKQITACEGFPPVVVLSADNDPSSVRRAFRAGPMGYVTHREAPDNLACAVREVVAGRRYESSGCVAGE